MRLNSKIILLLLMLLFSASIVKSELDNDIQYHIIETSIGKVRVSFVGDASLLFQLDTLNIYVDPCSLYVCTRDLPKADLILITNAHEEHFDRRAISKLFKHDVRVMGPRKCQEELNYMSVLNNDGWSYFNNIKIESYHSYNINKRDDNFSHFNVKWEGNGYVINFGKTRVYISGDTEIIPEMNFIGKVDVAFVPMNRETMSADEILKFIDIVKPKVIYPYHYDPLTVEEVKELFIEYNGASNMKIFDCYPEIRLKRYGEAKVLSY